MTLKKSSKVRQSNQLIESPYAQEFSAYEIKLFEIGGAFLTEFDIDNARKRINKRISFTTKELAVLLNTSTSSISHEIENTADKIMNKRMHLRKENEKGEIEFKMINIIPYAQYKNGVFEYELNHAVIPYIVEINKNFTEFQLHHLTIMPTAYSIKLYKLLYQYKKIQFREFNVNELRNLFGLSEKYQEYKSFKQRVIEPSVKQINKHTDLNVQYNEKKVGRKVDKLAFTFELKKVQQVEQESNKIIDIPIDNDLIIDNLEEQISSQTKLLIGQFAQNKGADYVEASIAYAKKNAKSNFDGYLANTLTKGWAELEVKKEKTKKVAAVIKAKETKDKSDEKSRQKELENITKSEVENEWHKLPDSKKAPYLSYADTIIKKHNTKLTNFDLIDIKLPLSIYAVSQNKYYDRVLESYIQTALNTSLNIINLPTMSKK